MEGQKRATLREHPSSMLGTESGDLCAFYLFISIGQCGPISMMNSCHYYTDRI